MRSSGPQPGVGVKPASWGEFVALPENLSALTATRRLARSLTRPRPTRRPLPAPLFLHGPPGTGKTFLLRALVRKLAAAPAGLTAQVVAARELGRATPDQPEDEFADWRSADLLAVEDVQHLPARSVADLCRLLDDRAARRRPTVVTGTAGPAGLTDLPHRLTSRLAAGLVVQLEPLTPPGRRTLLAHLAERRGVPLADDALNLLAARATGGGVRPLLGALETLAVRTRGVVEPMDAAAVEVALADDQPTSRRSHVDVIVAKVAAAFGVTPKELLGPGRQRAVLVPRQVAMYLAREIAKLSLPQVGTAFGRDHTTVLHACRKVHADLQADPKLRRTVSDLTAELG